MSDKKIPNITAILFSLAMLVLFYFAGDYMLAAVIKPMWKEGIIPGDEKTWRVYASLLKTVPGYVGLALTFLWGILADRLGRPRLLLTLGLLIGFSLTMVGLATNYAYLLAVLIVFGVAKIGIGPVIYAFIPDIMPPEKRGTGYAAYYAPSVLGFLVGMVIGGILFYWRVAYLLTGLMVIFFTIPLYVFSHRIRIGEAEKPARLEAYSLRKALRAAMNRTVLIMMLQIIPWTIPWGFITLYAVDYLMTRWGITKEVASGVLAIASISIALGHIIGGKLSDSRVNKGDVLGRVKISAIGIIIGYLAMLGMFVYPYPYGSTSLKALLPPTILALAGLLFTTFAYPNISSIISECVRPEYRGTVFSVYNILNTAGWATGPALYSLLVEWFMDTYPERTAIMYAAVVLESLWLVSLAAWLVVAKTYPKDRISLQ
ncbi:MFS transporter [Pyrofollis japonicus]|uniref:MFS transporter n=1 Tax=Pyrofollis japonicus TaxID=3060460 RepID=UPI00295B0566|nr:MFS transporter [Pyrofollis japonicus]BEP18558.1 MFS transporter [Pyrofollis japonicus]